MTQRQHPVHRIKEMKEIPPVEKILPIMVSVSLNLGFIADGWWSLVTSELRKLSVTVERPQFRNNGKP